MIPKEMKDTPNWVLEGNKVPYDPKTIETQREKANQQDITTWGTYKQCKALLKKHKEMGYHIFDHIGYVFGSNNDIICVDIDHCTNTDGTLTEFAQEIVSKFNSYTEWSMHHHGLHIYLKGKLPADKYVSFTYHLEICDRGCHYVVSEEPYLDLPLIENQDAIDWLIDKYIDKEKDVRNLVKD